MQERPTVALRMALREDGFNPSFSRQTFLTSSCVPDGLGKVTDIGRGIPVLLSRPTAGGELLLQRRAWIRPEGSVRGPWVRIDPKFFQFPLMSGCVSLN